MQIVEIVALENGAHRNQSGVISAIPGGWAVIPNDMDIPNFPFGEIEVEKIGGVLTVTKWIPGELPVGLKTEAEQKSTQFDRIEAQATYTAMMTDTLLGVYQ